MNIEEIKQRLRKDPILAELLEQQPDMKDRVAECVPYYVESLEALTSDKARDNIPFFVYFQGFLSGMVHAGQKFAKKLDDLK